MPLPLCGWPCAILLKVLLAFSVPHVLMGQGSRNVFPAVYKGPAFLGLASLHVRPPHCNLSPTYQHLFSRLFATDLCTMTSSTMNFKPYASPLNKETKNSIVVEYSFLDRQDWSDAYAALSPPDVSVIYILKVSRPLTTLFSIVFF